MLMKTLRMNHKLHLLLSIDEARKSVEQSRTSVIRADNLKCVTAKWRGGRD